MKKLPKHVLSILSWSIPVALQDPIIGDIEEGLEKRADHSLPTTLIWLYKQTFSLIWHYMLAAQKGTIMFFLGLLTLLAVIAMTFVLGGGASLYVDIPSGIIVFTPALIVGFISVGKKQFFESFHMILDMQKLTNTEVTEKDVRVFDVMSTTATIMGWFGVVSGIVAMSANIKAEVFSTVFGPSLAVCLLTLLYSIIVKAVCYMAKQHILSNAIHCAKPN